jgi:hypothetical protein
MAQWLFIEATGPVFGTGAHRLSRWRRWTAGITQLRGSADDHKPEWISSGFAQVIASAPKNSIVVESRMVTWKTPRRS